MFYKKEEDRKELKDFKKYGLDIDYIEKLAIDGATPGFALSLISREIELNISFGHYSDSNSPMVSGSTLYDIASITKLFTAFLVLELNQVGKLSINDHCSIYLSNFRDSQVKLIDLLTHKVNFAIALGHYRESYPNTFEEEIMKITPPKSPSRSIYYANLGYIYLGKIIEQIENTKLNDIMIRFVVNLGLKSTTTGVEIGKQTIPTPPTELINGITVQNLTHDESARLLGGIAGNAGIFTSAQDLALFGKTWLDGEIVDRKVIDDIVFRNYDLGNNKPQALGWWLRVPLEDETISTEDVYSHTGFTGSYLAINPTNSKVCAFTCNRTYYGRDNHKHKKIWKILTDWMVD